MASPVLRVLVFFNLLMLILYTIKSSQSTIDIQKRHIPRDISEHSELVPTYDEIYSSIRNEPSKWVSTFEKTKIVGKNWLSHVMI